jgi:hypothetical protein
MPGRCRQLRGDDDGLSDGIDLRFYGKDNYKGIFFWPHLVIMFVGISPSCGVGTCLFQSEVNGLNNTFGSIQASFEIPYQGKFRNCSLKGR